MKINLQKDIQFMETHHLLLDIKAIWVIIITSIQIINFQVIIIILLIVPKHQITPKIRQIRTKILKDLILMDFQLEADLLLETRQIQI